MNFCRGRLVVNSMKLSVLLLFSCNLLMSQAGRTMSVAYDSSRCSYCKMLIQEKTFGAELDSDSGIVYVFDATECLAAYLIDQKIATRNVREVWSVDYRRPGKLVVAESAVYIHSDKLLSPMSMNVAAVASRAEAEEVLRATGGEILNWQGVLDLVRARWFPAKKQEVK
jgi:copper chaperone NosL